jgi:hypothetical protein
MMTCPRIPSGAFTLPVAIVLLAPVSSSGQVATAGARSRNSSQAWNAPRTAWGQPDLQGVWDFATITPLERPADLAGKDVLTQQEAAEFEKQTLQRRNADRRDGGADADVGRAYNQFWWDYGTRVIATKRTSLVVDPPDGKIPPLTPAGQKRTEARAAVLRRPPAGPEDRNLWERCILAPNAGPPMLPSAYNNNVQIFQTPTHVVVFNEMINDARIIPLDGRPHIPAAIRQWKGDSRGRWEGGTLVVETTNFRDDSAFRGATANLQLVERFSRAGPDTLLYEFTATDTATWSRPWSVALPMSKADGPIYEYACHEGNYGMLNMLAGARAQEKAAAEGAGKEAK